MCTTRDLYRPCASSLQPHQEQAPILIRTILPLRRQQTTDQVVSIDSRPRTYSTMGSIARELDTPQCLVWLTRRTQVGINGLPPRAGEEAK